MSEAAGASGAIVGQVGTQADAADTIKGQQADYIPATWTGENTSGLRPYGKNVLVRMDECAQQSKGVWMTDERKERMDAHSVTGCVYAIGPEAFRQFDDGLPWQGDKPVVGERVYTEKYPGAVAIGMDGFFYRIMDYRCIAGGYLDAAAAMSADIDHRVE